jgi:glycosyltransferase involved in cell wall biosynthesis
MLNLGINLVEFKKDYVGGINTYAIELIKELEKKKINIYIFTNKDSANFLKKNLKNSYIIVFKKNKFVFLFLQLFCIILDYEKLFCWIENYYYKDVKKIIEEKCDVFYCPLTYLKPYNLRIPTISSPHDFQHLHFPKYFNYFRLKYRNIAFNLTVKKTTIIQASSSFIKNDIQKKFGISKNKIIIINEGVSNEFIYSKINLKKNDYIFLPAQLWEHKNHITVLNSLKLIYEKHKINLRLIMVGEKFNAYKKVFNFIQKNKQLKVQYLGKVTYKKLKNLYNNCRFVICPSLHESNNLPILEACKIGRPVICSDIEPNIELKKKIKLNLFESKNSSHLAELFINLWSKKKLLKSQTNFNKKVITNYSWSKVAKKYIKIFDKLKKKN